MSIGEVMKSNCAIRTFADQPLERAMIQKLLNAAVLAPTAMRQEPWQFVVVQDKQLMHQLSEEAKAYTIEKADALPAEHRERLVSRSRDPAFDVFYNAPAVILIYAKPMGPFVEADCWLAAENLMLESSALGLGTCVVGLAIGAIDQPKWKQTFGLAPETKGCVAVIVGIPEGDRPMKIRKAPDVIWS